MVDVGMTVILGAEPPDEIEVVPQHHRIVEVRDRKRSICRHIDTRVPGLRAR
jgi:hypothetical protein